MKLPDGTYWLSLHGPDKAETGYAGYYRIPCEFIDGENASTTHFGKCLDDDRHLIEHIGVSYTRQGTPFNFLSLTCPTSISKNVSPNAAARMLSVKADS